MIRLKSPRQIEKMRCAGSKLAQIFFEITPLVKAGTTTLEIDSVFEEKIRAFGGKPAFKGYRGYPKSLCVSINDEIVHGIPCDRIIKAPQPSGWKSACSQLENHPLKPSPFMVGNE